MELKILEESKNRLVVEVKGETHTFCNLIVKELWNDEHVKAAAYNISHPLIGIPKILVETDKEEEPRKALSEAAKRLKKELDKFRTEFKSAGK